VIEVIEVEASVLATELSEEEKIKLWHCEVAIEAGFDEADRGLSKSWRALQVIQNDRLYRGKYATFEEYCRERWDKSSRYIYRIINAGEVQEYLRSFGPMGPKNERQLRPLTSLSRDQQQAAVEAVNVLVDGGTLNTPIAEDYKRAAEAARSPQQEFAVGQTLYVIDRTHLLFNRAGQVVERSGLAIQLAFDNPESKVWFLTNQVGTQLQAQNLNPIESKTIEPPTKQQTVDRVEGLESANRVAQIRTRLLTDYLREGVELVQGFVAGECDYDRARSFIAEASKVLG